MKKATAVLLVLAMVLSFGSVAALATDTTSLPDPVDGVITLTSDVTLADTAVISSDTKLDLAGYTLTGTASGRALRVEAGTLTVTDSSASGTGKIVVPEKAQTIAIIVNTGLVLEAGAIEVSGQDSAGVRAQSGGKAELKGGTITANGVGSMGAAAMDNDTSVIDLSGTEISAKGQGCMGIYLAGSDQKAVVSGGKIAVDGSDSYGIQTVEMGPNGHVIEISGGEINASGNRSYAVCLEMDNRLTISGGTLKSADSCAVAYFQGGNTGTITGGTIEGKTYGVQIQNSANNTLSISGDAVISGGTDSIRAGGNRYKATPAVTISGGYFNGAVAGGVPSDKTDNYAIYDITGGYFTEPIADSALYNYALAKDYTPETYTDEVKAGETNKIKTVSVQKDGVTYGYQIGQPQPGYVLMNIPYAEFYAGEGIADVDGVTSATKNKPRTATLAGGSYHKNADGTDISGVIYPVYVEDLAMLAGFKQVTDEDSVSITVTNRGQTTTTTFTGKDALFENEDHAYYVLDTEPNAYKTLTMQDGKCSFSATTAAASSGEATATSNYSDHHADIVLTLTADALDASKATVNGVIITAKDASGKEAKYALRHIAELWRVSQIGWSWSSMDGAGLAGGTVTNVTYYLRDADGSYQVVSYDVNIPIKLHAEGMSAAFDDAKTLTLTGLPGDIENPAAKVASKVGKGETPVVIAKNASVQNGKVVCTEEAVDGTTYTVTVTSDNYADLSAEAIYEQKACPGDESCPSKKFKDVDQAKWYHEVVDYAVVNGLFQGTSEDTFEPDAAMTRGMFVTVLHRMEGTATPKADSKFTDLTQDWYKEAVAWAAENGIVNGTSATTFAPDEKITREQAATMLMRYAAFKGVDVSKTVDLSKFGDAASISGWADAAVHWAVAEELIQGMPGNLLQPQGDSTRAQIATILMRFQQNLK